MFQTARLTSEVGSPALGYEHGPITMGGKQGRDGNPMLKHGRLMAEDKQMSHHVEKFGL